jgi:hypothetical protein
MPYSYAITIASGSTANVSVPFPYLNKEHVHVSLDTVKVNDALLLWLNDGVIRLSSTPTAGQVVKVYRDTPKISMSVVFASPAILEGDELNAAFTQLLYVCQEAFDASDTVPAELEAVLDALNGGLATISSDLSAAATAVANAQAAAASAALSAANAAAIGGFDPALFLLKTGNLAGLANNTTALTNIGAAADSAVLKKANNLSELADIPTALANLGLAAFGAGYPYGLEHTWVGNTSYSVLAGIHLAKDHSDFIKLASAITKTTGAWAVGSGNGALDIGTVEATKWYYSYLIKRADTGVVDALLSLSPDAAFTVTISNASPAVFTKADGKPHGLQVNAPVVGTTTGTLPTGLTAGQQLFVKTVLSPTTFTVAASQGGSVINTSGAGSGTHTATSTPIYPANYNKSQLMMAMDTDAGPNIRAFSQEGDEVLFNTSRADINYSGFSASSEVLFTLSVPPVVKATARIRAYVSPPSDGSLTHCRLSSPDEGNLSASGNLGDASMIGSSGTPIYQNAGHFDIRTDQGGRIRGIVSVGGTYLAAATYGFIFTRRRYSWRYS